MGNRTKPVEIPGIGVFESLKDAQAYFGISPATYTFRIKNGMTPIEALTTPIKIKSGKSEPIEIPGVGKFKSIKEACDYFGTPYKTYASRTSKGMDKIRAITLPVGEHGNSKYREECGKTLDELAQDTGISRKEIQKRIKDGMSLEDALKAESNKRRYTEFRKECSKYGIDYNSASHYRIKHPELTDEQIIRYYLVKEKAFKQKCLKTGINYNSAIRYKNNHPEMTENEVISHYIKGSYVDWYDNLVIDGRIINFEE